MSVKKRLEEFCEYRKISIGGFCREAKISNSYFNNVRGEMGPVIKGRIKDAYKDLNLEWLLTGEGEMLNFTPVQAAVMTPHPVSSGATEITDIQGNYDTSVVVSVVEQPPIIPDAIARKAEIDILKWAESNAADHSKNAFDILDILKKTAFIIKMTNDAMAPSLYQNEFVFLKPLPDNTLIIDGDPYGIDTNNRGLLIRLLYDKGDHYLARPKNRREYGDIKIPKHSVIRVYFPLFHGSTQLSSVPNTDIDLAQRDKQITQQGTQINSLITQLDKSGQRADRLIEQNAELIKKIIDK